MIFGIELEFFILNHLGQSLNKKELDLFYNTLSKKARFTAVEKNESQFKTTFSIDKVSIGLSNDYCSHIFEIEFPPMSDIDQFERYFNLIYKEIEIVCKELNYRILNNSVSKSEPNLLIKSNSDNTGKRMKEILCREKIDSIFFDTQIMAKMTSIHIHLDYKPESFPNILKFYEYEYLFPLLFSNSKIDSFHCKRPILYKNNFNYNLNGFPISIPSSFNAYSLSRKENKFIRDYSFVCIRDEKNTLEFRGTDSTLDINSIKEIIALRLAISKINNNNNKIGTINLRDHYYEICRDKKFNPEQLHYHLEKLSDINLNYEFNHYLEKTLDKINLLLTLYKNNKG